jgi:thiol-disulfide isomerase/thioredoxin
METKPNLRDIAKILYHKHKTKVSIGIFVGFLVAVMIHILVQNGKVVDTNPLGLDQSQALDPEPPKFPNFTFYDKNGKRISFDDYKGKVVLVSFWASWCAPCQTEIPMFEALKQKLKEKDFEILAINLDDNREDAMTFINEYWPKYKISFPYLFDPEKTSAQKLNLQGLPSNYLISRKQKVIFDAMGLQDWFDPQIVKMIEDALDEKI